ncbi:hypothetical protein Patl1_31393 [Pistacia atlantica]|uniref:Uncharacterized protein n=1 Tax=Pistacia atlantica TaxID=434234 RepID=A0ACC1ALV9_9ROSI|nr:hypothetical protein Patl1_31393 [Pistacia atlantica]
MNQSPGGIENATGLFGLQHLKSLNLAYNQFDATQIPSRLANLRNLTYLNLSNAGFGGQIPIEISNMARLVTLDLSSLSYSGSSLESQNLRASPLNIENSNLSTFPLKFEIPNSSTSLELKISTTSLFKLKISNLSLLIQNFTQLRELYLDGLFSLSGPITSSFAKLRSLSVIRLDQNSLSSLVPKVLAQFMNLTSLRLSNCGLRGTFPQKILQLATLEHLDLSNNKFLQGSLPNFPQNQSLRTLTLTFTNFSGILPDSIANLKNLSRIELSNCNFTGAIPTSMANLTQIVYLDLSSNRFTWSNAHLSTRSKNLSYLDLSRNQLTEASAWPTTKLRAKFLDFPDASSSLLDTLDLSGNRLEGPIPMLEPIPSSVGNLGQLESFDLSWNQLSGEIPLQLASLNFLSFLNLSNNHFLGKIPSAKSEDSAPALSKELDWQFIVTGTGFGIASAVVVVPLMFSDKVNQWYDDHMIDELLMVVLPMFGLIYKTSHQRRIEAEKDLEEENTDEDDDEYDETETEEFRGRYCVLCSKLDVTRERVVHDPKFLVSGQCQSDQQSLLLQLKNSVVFNSNSSVNLAHWDQNTDCCNWSGVDCDDAGHVIGLNLSNESISGGIENATGLFALQNLNSLNLAYNKFNATQIPSRLANLTNLTYLNLSNAGFAGQIPSSISGMTKLVTLDLSSLTFVGVSLLKLENPNLSTFLQNFTEIRELYLDGVNISAQGNEWCQALSSSLPNLQVLSMSSCFLSGPIDLSLGNLQSLSVIRLNQNNLSSPVPDILANFSNLTSLHLSNCGLQGTFPEKILQVPTLGTLDLSHNNLLQGSLPDFPRNNSLRSLMLQETSLSGPLLDSIGELKSLSRIELTSCNFTGPIPTSLSNLTQLVYLDLSLNNFTGPVPPLHMSKNLSYLDLSQNHLTGAISFTEWKQLLYLVYVDLWNNSLEGKIPSSLFSRPLLKQLQLANNQFEGQLPEFLNPSTSVLETLDLTGNRLEGHIPMSIFELKHLSILLLSSNKFNGTVQLDKVQKLGNLTRLDFSYNSLVVNASSGSSFPPKISTLKLASCNLSMIPDLKNQTNLYQLDLSDNQISGEIPNWIWRVGNGNLIHLNLSHNLLVGLQEPYNLSNLSVLDLHFNKLQGEIPKPPQSAIYAMMADEDEAQSNLKHLRFEFLGLTQLYYQDSVTVTSKGQEMELVKILTIFTSIDLSSNKLEGPIPEVMGQFISLYVLNLSNNALTGTIPISYWKLATTGVLGPLSTQLQSFSSTSFEGNERLCGPPLTNNCTTNSSKSEHSAPALSKEFDWQFIVIGIAFGIGSAVVVAPLMFSDKVNQWYDDHIIDELLMVILPMFGLMYKTSHQRRIEAEEYFEDENTDEDDVDFDETQTKEFRGRYCVFCSKLDVTRKRVLFMILHVLAINHRPYRLLLPLHPHLLHRHIPLKVKLSLFLSPFVFCFVHTIQIASTLEQG